MSVFTTEVQSIGLETELFKGEKMVILFGKDAPDVLINYCYNIEVRPVTEAITDKQTLMINERTYQTTAMDEVVLTNLDTLGCITIKFGGATTPKLLGTLYVEEEIIPGVTVDTIIIIP